MVSAAAQSHLVQESSSTAPSQEAAPQEDAAQEVEVEEGEGDEEEGECGFCLFMKGGGCKEAFVAWEECVEAAEKEGSDVVERCFQATANLKKCMDAHADYYAPVLQAEQAVSDHAEAAIAANADKKNEEKSAPSPATDGESKAETVTEKAFSSPAAEEAVVEKMHSSCSRAQSSGGRPSRAATGDAAKQRSLLRATFGDAALPPPREAKRRRPSPPHDRRRDVRRGGDRRLSLLCTISSAQ